MCEDDTLRTPHCDYAFETIDAWYINYKMQTYDIQGKLLNCIKEYLIKRM